MDSLRVLGHNDSRREWSFLVDWTFLLIRIEELLDRVSQK